MVESIVEEGKTRSLFDKWKDEEFVAIMDLFREEFATGGIKLALCKRKSASGTRRWLEFIDVDTIPGYVPQYDVSNLSGQKIKTCYTTLEFPSGVAVEELRRWGKARERLKEQCPIYVKKLLEQKSLEEEYRVLVEDVAAQCEGSWKKWNKETLLAVVEAHKPKFEAKKVAIFIGMKDEYISHGQYGGHMEYFRWIEFVDREQQPNYFPQHDADTKSDGCVIF